MSARVAAGEPVAAAADAPRELTAPVNAEAPGELTVPVTAVAVREFTVPAPPPTAHCPAVRQDARVDPVHGCLVGISDGRFWGWWGPVERTVAEHALVLFNRAFPRLPAEAVVAGFARRLRRATRHAHSGLLAIAVGSLELALWDLAGKRAGCPVWALLAPRAIRTVVPAYATCFGVACSPGRVAAVMAAVADGYPVQKWGAAVVEPGLARVSAGFVARCGLGRLAIDFHGTWHPDRVRAACLPLAGALAWVEEPYHPDEVDRARAGEFGVPHAAGEHCYGTADAAQLLAGHVDIWQPDAVFCGGFVNLMTLAAAAVRAGARCAPHGGGLLPALHLAAVDQSVSVIEQHLLLEPRRCAHLAGPPRLDGAAGTPGALPVPDRPGWCGDLLAAVTDG